MNDRRELALRERIDHLIEQRDEARDQTDTLLVELDRLTNEKNELASRIADLERALKTAGRPRQVKKQRCIYCGEPTMGRACRLHRDLLAVTA